MQKYSREIVAQVLAANDIVDVIGASLELKSSGTNRYKALCPFHQEKTPSFQVNREKQMYYCFGCEKGGDAIRFLCEHDGLTFIEALRKLADRAGIRLPAPTEREGKDESLRLRLLEVGTFAAKFFRDMLNDPLKGGVGRRYLKTRRLKDETVKRFGLGYAPDSHTALGDAARSAGFNDGVLEAAGLVKRGERGTTYAFFRNRLMFPIRDVSGNVVAFGGRDLGEQPQAKYINTVENPVYKKGRMFYGLHEARDSLRKTHHAILVEGYFDLLRCFDAGIENVVAPCGTALTPEQATLLRRYVPEMVVVFDGDAAGVRAALRSIAILTGAGLGVRALLLPDGQDPDDYILAAGGDAFRERVENALDFITFYVRMNEERTRSIEGRTDVAREIFTILLGVDDALRRDEYLKRLAIELGLNEWTARSEFDRWFRQRPSREAARREQPAGVARLQKDDVDFIAAVAGSEPLLEKARAQLADVKLQPGPVVEVLCELFADSGADIAQRIESEEARALYAAAVNASEARGPANEALVEKRITRLKIEAIRVEEAHIQEALHEVRREQDLAWDSGLLQKAIDKGMRRENVGAP